MVMGKLQLGWIIDNGERNARLKKRRNGLVKKVRELSILCGVGACVIIFSPGEPEPTVWPPFEKILQLFHCYKDVPEIERWPKNRNIIEYLENTLGKLLELLIKARFSNDKLEKYIESVMVSRNSNEEEVISHLSFQIENGSRGVETLDMNETCKMMAWLERKMEEINIWENEGGGAEVAVVANQVGAGGPSGDGTCYDVQDPTSWDTWYRNLLSRASNVAGGSSGGSGGGGGFYGGASGFDQNGPIPNVMGQNDLIPNIMNNSRNIAGSSAQGAGFHGSAGGVDIAAPQYGAIYGNHIPNTMGQYGPNLVNSSSNVAGSSTRVAGFHGSAGGGGVGAPQYGGIYGGASGYGHRMGGWQLNQNSFTTNHFPNVMGQYGQNPSLMNSSSNAASSRD